MKDMSGGLTGYGPDDREEIAAAGGKPFARYNQQQALQSIPQTPQPPQPPYHLHHLHQSLHHHQQQHQQPHILPNAPTTTGVLSPTTTAILEGLDDEETDEEDGTGESGGGLRGNEKRSGRRKIKIEYIGDKSRRHITFSKRKAGIMKKAYELSTLTGTQVLLLVASETGHVYTFATPKLQPLITKPEGKNLIQACLNAPDASDYEPVSVTGASGSSGHHNQPYYPPYPQSGGSGTTGRLPPPEDDYPPPATGYPQYNSNSRSNAAYYYQPTGGAGNTYPPHGFWQQPPPPPPTTQPSATTTPTTTPLMQPAVPAPNYPHHAASTIGHHHD